MMKTHQQTVGKKENRFLWGKGEARIHFLVPFLQEESRQRTALLSRETQILETPPKLKKVQGNHYTVEKGGAQVHSLLPFQQ